MALSIKGNQKKIERAFGHGDQDTIVLPAGTRIFHGTSSASLVFSPSFCLGQITYFGLGKVTAMMWALHAYSNKLVREAGAEHRQSVEEEEKRAGAGSSRKRRREEEEDGGEGGRRSPKKHIASVGQRAREHGRAPQLLPPPGDLLPDGFMGALGYVVELELLRPLELQKSGKHLLVDVVKKYRCATQEGDGCAGKVPVPIACLRGSAKLAFERTSFGEIVLNDEVLKSAVTPVRAHMLSLNLLYAAICGQRTEKAASTLDLSSFITPMQDVRYVENQTLRTREASESACVRVQQMAERQPLVPVAQLRKMALELAGAPSDPEVELAWVLEARDLTKRRQPLETIENAYRQAAALNVPLSVSLVTGEDVISKRPLTERELEERKEELLASPVWGEEEEEEEEGGEEEGDPDFASDTGGGGWGEGWVEEEL